ncbi:putative E3 ubiquitin-protein ligase LIN-1 [Cocos nucifera]|uniref:Putative E3 ubiquitin-protein ligase LIN-1 n=1 Tax=Cocos nucifera TaxID=13894 RepID=A0A8K0IYP4_COCNU|nr:putative E3 ubiquitin-protein ligase LIN-1 [Cocos nucifera]
MTAKERSHFCQVALAGPHQFWILSAGSHERMFHPTFHSLLPTPTTPLSLSLSLSRILSPNSFIPSPSSPAVVAPNSMAPASNSSLSSTSNSHLDNRLDFASIWSLVSLVNRHIHRFLSDPAARKSLQVKCTSNITISNHGGFEFSEHSVLSNLYWGIENIELAIQSNCQEESNSRLANSEKMLQVPALLEEDGSMDRIENRYIVCCSYFYLSLVRKLRGDQWQMTMHFLQSVLVFPRLVRTELAPGLWRALFGSLVTIGDTEEAVDEAAKQQGRRYKDWLMYYQVVSYGETPPWIKGCAGADNCSTELLNLQYRSSASTRCLNSLEHVTTWPSFRVAQMVYPPISKENIEVEKIKASTANSEECEGVTKPKNENSILKNLDEGFHEEINESFDIRCLQDMLEESQSDSPVSFYSHIESTEASDSEMRMQGEEIPEKILTMHADHSASNTGERTYLRNCSSPECLKTSPDCPTYSMHVEVCEANANCLLSSRSHSSLNNLRFSILDLRDAETYPIFNCSVEDETPTGRSPVHDLRCFSNFSSKFRKKYGISELVPRGSIAKRKTSFSNSEKDRSDESSDYGKDNHSELLERSEKAVSILCFSDGPGKCEDADVEVSTIWELLNTKKEVRYSSVKQEIIDQLLHIISTSKKEKLVRASVSMLLLLISEDQAVIEDIKKKDLHLSKLASALKRNVQEAAILIYLLNPSPTEIKGLEILPALVEVACNSNGEKKGSLSLPLTPTSASIALIEVLVTAFDYVTNNMHLAAISSPQILSKLVNVAMNKNLEEGVALAAILVRCMRLNGNCKKFLSQVTPVDPFLYLLRSNERRAKFAALEYFHEILRMPRSSAIHLLHQIRQQGSISIMHTLMTCIQQAGVEHQLLAANLLIQLDILEHSSGKSVFKEEAMEVLLESVASEEDCSTQTLAAFILSNLGGTYSWTGEPYTAAWLVKRAGLTSVHHRHMIRKVDWSDPCLQDGQSNAWSAKSARGVIRIGRSVFNALARGIQSRIKSVSRDCLICITWLGSEMAVMGPSRIRYYACEILLSEITQFLHPGSGLDERILACLSVYNYTSGKGKQKLMNFSEGLRESLRRLSGYTWMAEELLKVTDYFLPTKPHVSCVHTQILEVDHLGSGAATALIFYKGQLCAGYSDGSIKVWDVKGQRAMFVLEVKEHKRPVTCFTLFEPGDSLLSGSSDKTVRVWKMIQRKLECVEVIEMKDPIQKVDTCGDKILMVTQSNGLKVCHASRSIQTTCKNKHVKCLRVIQGKIYLGCADSSIQEVDIMEDNKTEIRPPTKSWRLQNKSLNSILPYKGWVYCGGTVVEGYSMKEWRKHCRLQVSIAMERGTNVQLMSVVEDFIYLNCSSSPSIIQIWLRGTQQKVGRLSAGSKITSLLTANDIIFCGSETGLIKGWIPL